MVTEPPTICRWPPVCARSALARQGQSLDDSLSPAVRRRPGRLGGPLGNTLHAVEPTSPFRPGVCGDCARCLASQIPPPRTKLSLIGTSRILDHGTVEREHVHAHERRRINVQRDQIGPAALQVRDLMDVIVGRSGNVLGQQVLRTAPGTIMPLAARRASPLRRPQTPSRRSAIPGGYESGSAVRFANRVADTDSWNHNERDFEHNDRYGRPGKWKDRRPLAAIR